MLLLVFLELGETCVGRISVNLCQRRALEVVLLVIVDMDTDIVCCCYLW